MTDIWPYRGDVDRWAGISRGFWNEKLKYLEQVNPNANFLTTDSTWTIEPDLCKKYLCLYWQLIASSALGNRLNFSSNVVGENRWRDKKGNRQIWSALHLYSRRLSFFPNTTTTITVIRKCKRQFSWVCRFLAPSVFCGVGVIYCSL